MNRSLMASRPLLQSVDVLALFVLLLLTLLCHRPMLLGAKVPVGDDVLLQNLPQAKILFEAIQKNRIPFWTDQAYTGFPFYAEGQAGVFYPPTQLLHRFTNALSGDYVTAFCLDLFCHHLALAWLFYLFARQISCSVFSALMASVAFSFGGFVSGHLIHLNIIRSLVYLPLLWILALWAHRLHPFPSLRESAYSSLLLGLTFLAGHHQLAVFVVAAWAGWILFLERTYPRPGPYLMGRLVPRILPSFLLGGMLAAIQLAPTFGLFLESARRTGWGEQAVWSTTPIRLIYGLIPFLHGSERPSSPYFGPGNFHEFACYVGILPLFLLFLVPTFRSRAGACPYFFGLGCAGLVLSLGAYSPLYPLFMIPPLSLFRNPCRLLVLTEIAIVMLAARSLDDLAEDADPSIGPRLARLSTARIVGAVLLFSLLAMGIHHALSPNAGAFGNKTPATLVVKDTRDEFSVENLNLYPMTRLRLTLINAVRGVAIAALWLLLGIGLARLKIEGHLTSTMCGFWFSSTVAIDVVFGFSLAVFSYVNPSLLLGEPIPISHLKNAAPGSRVFIQPFDGPRSLEEHVRYRFYWASAFDNIPSLAGYTPLAPKAWGAFFRDPDRPIPPNSDETIEIIARIDPVADLWKLSLASVSFILSEAPISGSADLVPWLLEGSMKLYRNKKALPRAYLAHRLAPLGKGASELPLLKKLNSTLPALTVSEGGELSLVAAVAAPGEDVTLQSSRPEELVCLVRAKASAYLIVSDLFHPGWVATVDGQNVPLLRACGLFRAVKVDRGIHEVRMSFEPSLFRHGAYVTLLGLAIATLLVASGFSIQRKRVERSL